MEMVRIGLHIFVVNNSYLQANKCSVLTKIKIKKKKLRARTQYAKSWFRHNFRFTVNAFLQQFIFVMNFNVRNVSLDVRRYIQVHIHKQGHLICVFERYLWSRDEEQIVCLRLSGKVRRQLLRPLPDQQFPSCCSFTFPFSFEACSYSYRLHDCKSLWPLEIIQGFLLISNYIKFGMKTNFAQSEDYMYIRVRNYFHMNINIRCMMSWGYLYCVRFGIPWVFYSYSDVWI